MADEENQDNQDQQDNSQAQDQNQDAEDKKDEFVDDNSVPEGNGVVDDEEDKKDDKDPLDPEITDEDKKLIERQVKKQVDKLLGNLTKQTVNTELGQILAAHPEYKPYEAKIRRFVEHPNRAGLIKSGTLPVATVVLEAMAPHLEQLAAKKKADADTKARISTVNAEGTKPADDKKPDYSKMSSDEIKKIANQVKSGQFKAK